MVNTYKLYHSLQIIVPLESPFVVEEKAATDSPGWWGDFETRPQVSMAMMALKFSFFGKTKKKGRSTKKRTGMVQYLKLRAKAPENRPFAPKRKLV